jgi:hypothetical protein
VDSDLPEGFELVDGSGRASFAKVAVGSSAAHSYVVKVTGAEGYASFEPAKVTYKVDADGEEQVRAAGEARARPPLRRRGDPGPPRRALPTRLALAAPSPW